MKPWIAMIVAAGALAAAGSACSSSSNTSSNTTVTSPASSAPKHFEVTTPYGQVSISLDGKLPPGWPSGFPVPKEAQPVGSGSLGGAASTSLVAVYSSTSTPATLIDFYTSDTRLTTSGRSSIGAGSAEVVSVAVTAPYKAHLTALSRGTTTYLVIDLTQTNGGQG